MASAADIVLNLVAKTGKLTGPMKRASAQMGKFEQRVFKVGKALGVMGGVVATVGGRAIVSIVKETIEANDKLGKMALTVGIATDQLKGLQLAAELAGVKSESLNKALLKQSKAIVDAQKGLVTYKDAFDRIGVSTEKLLSLSPEEQFFEIGRGLQSLKSTTEQVAIASDLFGTKNAQLINLLINEQAEIEKTIEKAKQFGAALNDFDTAKFEVAADDITLMQTALTGMKNVLAISLLPFVKQISERFQDSATAIQDNKDASRTFALQIAQIVGAVVSVAKGFKALGIFILDIGLAVVAGVLKPLEVVEKQIRNITNLVPGILGQPTSNDTFLQASIDRIAEMRQGLQDSLLDWKGLVGESDAYLENWVAANKLADEQAAAIAKQREAQRQISDELARQEEAEAKRAEALKFAQARAKELQSLISGTRTQEEQLLEKIRLISVAINKGEGDRNALLEARRRIIQQLVDLNGSELRSIISSTTSQQERLVAQIRFLTVAVNKGEGDRNEILKARAVLIERLIALNEEEAKTLDQFGIQAARNLQTAFADWFKDMESGFDGILKSFVGMLRDMVAQLLARQVLLSFFGLFGGTSLGKSLLSGLETRHGGGPVQKGKLYQTIPGETFIPNVAGTILPKSRSGNFGGGNVFNFTTNISNNGQMDAETLVPILEENNRRVKGEFLDELNRGKYE